MFHICYYQNGLVVKGEEVPEARDGDLALEGVRVISYGRKPVDRPLEVVLESFYFIHSSGFG